MDSQLKDIQPGSGVVIHLEKAWGRVRRGWLKTFRRGYVARMAACRKGDFNPCPHDVLDPRDLKFYRNQGGWYWDLKSILARRFLVGQECPTYDPNSQS